MGNNSLNYLLAPTNLLDKFLLTSFATNVSQNGTSGSTNKKNSARLARSIISLLSGFPVGLKWSLFYTPHSEILPLKFWLPPIGVVWLVYALVLTPLICLTLVSLGEGLYSSEYCVVFISLIIYVFDFYFIRRNHLGHSAICSSSFEYSDHAAVSSWAARGSSSMWRWHRCVVATVKGQWLADPSNSRPLWPFDL